MLMINESVFTKQQLSILRVLADGRLHTRAYLLQHCMFDELGSEVNVSRTISNIRKKLPRGIEILYVCTNGKRGKGYRMVRTLNSGE